jgi:hypothetical protein
MEQIPMPQSWTDPLVQPKQWKRDVRFGTWSVRNLYKSGSLTTVARELVRNTSDFVGVQVRWEKGGILRAGDYIFFYRKGNNRFRTGCFVYYRIVSAVKRGEFSQ